MMKEVLGGLIMIAILVASAGIGQFAVQQVTMIFTDNSLYVFAGGFGGIFLGLLGGGALVLNI